MTGTLAELMSDWPNRGASRFVDTSSARWHIQRMGRGNTILLIHGTGSATHTWCDVLPELASGFDVIAVDLPGHGFSKSLRRGRMSPENLSRSLAELLHKLGVAPRAIVGHSAGAAIAIKLVLQEQFSPQCIVGINAALLPYGGSMSGVFGQLASIFAAAPFIPALVRRRVRDEKVVERMLASTGSQPDRGSVRRYQQLLSRSEHVRATLSMMADWNLSTLLDSLAPVASRCHLLTGDRDTAISPNQARIACRRYPAMRLTELSGVGHLLQEESPMLVARFIRHAVVGEGAACA